MVCNCKQVKRCAFCKHWYDPTSSAIVPKQPRINLWEIKEFEKELRDVGYGTVWGV